MKFPILSLLAVCLSGCVLGQQDTGDEAAATFGAVSASLECDVIVAGGTTAALSAALTAAREGARTCLVEPTDWPGGQLTAGGVPAIDFAWHKVDGYDVASVAKNPSNQPAEFAKWMSQTGNPGGCWVSRNCFEPKNLLLSHILPALKQAQNLTVLKNTVIKRVTTHKLEGRKRITSMVAIRRVPRNPQSWGGYDARMSSDLADWYSETDSEKFTKEPITLSSKRAAGPVVIDATEFGEVMVLARAAYLQGIETSDGSAEALDESCGQAFVFPFVMRWGQTQASDNGPLLEPDHPEFYGQGSTTWSKVWTYRRVRGSGASGPGQLSNQNWNPGNDYAYRYLLLARSKADAQIDDWKGGVDVAALDAAERHSLGWFRWFRDQAPASAKPYLSLAADVFGTAHGLSKYPYVRDTRRSVGVGGFVLSGTDLEGPASNLTGKRFIDRIALGAYNGDIHPMQGCTYPEYIQHELRALPFFLPLRALTNRDVANLLVAGKTMAQSFRANAATRLHPIEFRTGIGAGAAAAVMLQESVNDTETLVQRYDRVQKRVRKYAPLEWTIQGQQVPAPEEELDPL